MKIASVVLPTYNEKQNIERVALKVLEQEKKLPGWQVEVIIADSDSPDGTAEIAKNLAKNNSKIHFLEVERGLGIGLIKGHQYAISHLKPDVLVQMDADSQVDPDIIPRFIDGINKGFNLVIGSRFVPGGKNQLSFSRRIFTYASSWFCRLVMGPFNIKEFTNSARAFTPSLFQKINLYRLPWKEKSFISQPAFLNEAVLAGAKYFEIPLVFKDRAEGYSKNKVFNYSYDVIAYAIDARLNRMGIHIPLFRLSRRAKTFIKFGLVGITGTTVDFAFYNFFILTVGLRPATSKGLSTEIAIVNNFLWNNIWTFRHRNTRKTLWQKLGMFNFVSLGGWFIGVLIVKLLHNSYGDGVVNFLGLNIAYYNIYFFLTIPPVMIWNFTINHLVTWRHNPADD